MGAKYEATYVVFAVTATGDENVTCCHPDADSPENVAVANNVPVDDHKFPTCVPVFVEPLKNRTPVTKPSLSDRNFTPNSTAPVSPSAATVGVAPADQMMQGHPLAAAVVVKDHVVGDCHRISRGVLRTGHGRRVDARRSPTRSTA